MTKIVVDTMKFCQLKISPINNIKIQIPKNKINWYENKNMYPFSETP
jgi:hypothetical protein